jgi:hypothetical protein
MTRRYADIVERIARSSASSSWRARRKYFLPLENAGQPFNDECYNYSAHARVTVKRANKFPRYLIRRDPR